MTLATLRAVILALRIAQPQHAAFLGVLLDALDRYELGESPKTSQHPPV